MNEILRGKNFDNRTKATVHFSQMGCPTMNRRILNSVAWLLVRVRD